MIKSRHKSTAEAHENRDYSNRKPYRTKALKAEARARARKCEDGAYRSPVEVLYHAPVS